MVEEKDGLTGEMGRVLRKRKTNDFKILAKAAKIGQTNRYQIVKNKVAAPYRTVEVDIIFGEGIDFEADTYDMGVKYGILKTKSGGIVEYWDKDKNELLAGTKNKYDMIDLLIRMDLWHRFEKEVETEWSKRGTFQDSSETDSQNGEESSEASSE